MQVQKNILFLAIVWICYEIFNLINKKMGDPFTIAIKHILKNEGGFSLDPEDEGNYTPSGELKGTKYGISARSFPITDIKNLTIDEAIFLYYKNYWLKSIARDIQDIQLAYQVLDHSINAGIGSANKLFSQSGENLEKFKEQRKIFYTSIAVGKKAKYLKGWLKRIEVKI